jgi:hypothetical protein
MRLIVKSKNNRRKHRMTAVFHDGAELAFRHGDHPMVYVQNRVQAARCAWNEGPNTAVCAWTRVRGNGVVSVLGVRRRIGLTRGCIDVQEETIGI